MPIPSTGYAQNSIAALKAIAPTDRANGFAQVVLSKNAWYTYNDASTAVGDDNDVVVPADNPALGRWLKARAIAEAVSTEYTHWHDDSIILSGSGLSTLNNTNHAYLSYFLQIHIIKLTNTVYG